MARQELFVTKKSKGRPRGRVRPETTPVRVPVTLFAQIDAWIAARRDPKPSRSEAIRTLVVLGIKASWRESGE